MIFVLLVPRKLTMTQRERCNVPLVQMGPPPPVHTAAGIVIAILDLHLKTSHPRRVCILVLSVKLENSKMSFGIRNVQYAADVLSPMSV